MEPGVGLTVLGAAIGGAKVVEKLLGPTADYLGDGLRLWTHKRVNNVSKILEHARKRLGDRIEHDGSVPPRVLEGVLNDGSYCDDELAAEYFGGVLASSRSETSRDDRGAPFISLVARLSTYQLRGHFIFYSLVKELFDGSDAVVVNAGGREKLRVFVPFEVWKAAMELSDKEDPEVILEHVMFGMEKEGLIIGDFAFGEGKHLEELYGEAFEVTGIVFRPSVLGAELFLWAHGQGNTSASGFLRRDITFSSETTINIVPGYRALRQADTPTSDTSDS